MRGKSSNNVNAAAAQAINQTQVYDSRNMSGIYSDVSSNAGGDRHQEYKIRTVRSLAQAYHQQHSFGPSMPSNSMVSQSFTNAQKMKGTHYQQRPS